MAAPAEPSNPLVGVAIVGGFIALLTVILVIAQTLPGTIPPGARTVAALAPPPADPATAAAPTPSTAPAAPPAPDQGKGGTTQGQPGTGETVVLALGGDVHFEPPIRGRLSNPATALAPVKELMDGADVTMVNLETTITERGKAEPKTYTFRAPTSGLAALKSAGIDIVTAANNHGVDFGRQGLDDTIANLDKSGLHYVGIGPNAERAYAPYIAEVKGRRIAFFGITQVMDGYAEATWPAKDNRPGLAWTGDVNRLVDRIQQVRTTVDTVVVYVHWGVEGQHCPTTSQQTLAKQLGEAGADAVVGGHAHRLQGYGMMGDTFVAYGLGNFVFYAKPNEGADSGVLRLALNGRKVTVESWTPARIQDGVPRKLSGKDAEAKQTLMKRYQACSKLS